jgi:alpha-L-fucosidase
MKRRQQCTCDPGYGKLSLYHLFLTQKHAFLAICFGLDCVIMRLFKATISLLFSLTVLAQPMTDEQNSAAKKTDDAIVSRDLKLSDADMAWWRDARFGMFIHWGLYAIPAEGEWIMHNKKIPADEYAKLADQFNPQKFDATKWAAIAKRAGMKYMVLTSRHHDGFALWNSPSSWKHFNSVEAAAHRDFVKEYTAACREAGLKVGLYYSPMDWRFEGYFHPREKPESAQALKEQGYGQVRELMSNYGKIDILWYDGGWLAHKGTDADAAWFWEPLKLNAMVRQLQPKVVISPRSGWEGDFTCDEGPQAIKGPIRKGPWEKCLNLNETAWGYTSGQNLMPLKRAIHMLIDAVVRDGNVLLNVGPDRDGVIPDAHVRRLEEIGDWLNAYGEAIYATRAGPFEPIDGVVGSTHRGNTVYLLITNAPESGELKLPSLNEKVTDVKSLSGGEASVSQAADATNVSLKSAKPDPAAGVMVLKLTLDRDVP